MGLIAGYRRFWTAHVVQHWKPLLVAVVLMTLAALASALYAKFVQRLFQAFEQGDVDFLVFAPLFILGLATLRAVTLFAQVVMTNRIMLGIQADLQKRLYNHLIAADLTLLQKESAASFSARMWADSALVIRSLNMIMGGAANALTVIATFIMMLTIDWYLTLMIFAVFALVIWPLIKIGDRVHKMSGEVQQNISDMTSETHEGLSSMRLVRAYSLENHLMSQGAEVIERLRRAGVKVADWRARVEPMMEMLGGISAAALLALVVWNIKAGTGSLADFMALLTGLGVVSTPARRLGGVYTDAQSGLAAIDRIFGILDQKNEIVEKADAVSPGRATGALKFDDVGFKYVDGTRALAGIDLQIEAGKKVAFVGRSGAGKTSLFNLLTRLFDPSEGGIQLDGTDIRDLTLEGLRQNIAVVSQDSVLLTATVADNIAFGRPGASREEIEAAAKAAQAHDFISALSDGFDTLVRPSEASFSGGEKQRLSIARAILRDAPILLLDEPTSALDAESESAIRDALGELSSNRTTLVIAHRLSTILDSDMIVVLDKGRIVEMGSHEVLLANNDAYAKLYHLQFDDGSAV